MAVAIDVTSISHTGNNVTSISWTHTPSGTPSAVGVTSYGFSFAAPITATVTYGGTTMSQATSGSESVVDTSFIFGLANPASGAQTVAMSFSGSYYPIATSITVTGSDTTTCYSNTATPITGSVGAGNTSLSITCTSASGELVLSQIGADTNTPTISNPSGTQTDYMNNTVNGGENASAATQAGAASVTSTWNLNSASGGTFYILLAASFKAAGAAAVVFANQAFFDTVKLRPPTEFSQGPFKNVSPALSSPYRTSAFFEPFRPKPPSEFMQGPFKNVSPALTNPLRTVPFFDQTQKLKPPERLVESPPKTTPYSYITQNYFDQTSKLKLPERLQEAPPGTSPALTNPLRTVQFFDKNERVKTPDRFVEAPPGTSPQITAPYITSNLFDAAKLLKPLDRLQEAFGVQFPTPQILSAWFEQIKLKPPQIDNAPVTFQPSAVVVAQIVEQSFFDTVKPKPPGEFTQGPFAGTSPAIGSIYITQGFFDQIKPKAPTIDNAPALFQPAITTIVEQALFDTVKLKQPSEFTQGPFAGTSPAISNPYFTQSFFDQVRLKQPIIDKPSDMAPLVVAVNLSAANWFDAVRLLKIPDRFGELYPQQYWTPENFDQWFDQLKLLKVPERLQEAFGAPFPPGQSLTAWFDQIKKLKVPEDFPFTATGATQPVTIQNALTDWFSTVKLKQPNVETPLVVFFPAQNIVVTPEIHALPHFATFGRMTAR